MANECYIYGTKKEMLILLQEKKDSFTQAYVKCFEAVWADWKERCAVFVCMALHDGLLISLYIANMLKVLMSQLTPVCLNEQKSNYDKWISLLHNSLDAFTSYRKFNQNFTPVIHIH